MKIALHCALCGALIFSGGAGRAAFGQSAAAKPAAAAKTNGFDLLMEAGAGYKRGPEGEPMSTQVMPVSDNLAAQRQSVTRNDKALKLVRQALQLPIMHPPVKPGDDYPDYTPLRVLARLLKQEWSVKIGQNDWNGAFNSQLDAVEMGVAMTRGGGIEAVETGLAIENLGRLGLDLVVRRLTPQEALQGAARLAKIEALRPPMSDILSAEKSKALGFTQYSMETRDWEDVIMGRPEEDPNAPPPAPMPDGEGMIGEMGAAPAPPPAKSPFNPQEIDRLRNMGLTELQSNLSRYYDALIISTRTPYGAPKPNLAAATDPWSRLMTKDVADPLIRLSYEASRAQNLLLSQSLTLAAARITTGNYPETFSVPLDPFRPAQPLIYKRQGDGFLLYSVGPDGKDDGGTAAPTQTFKRDDQPGAVSSGLELKTVGDILAPVF